MARMPARARTWVERTAPFGGIMQTATCEIRSDSEHEFIAERRLWTAVIVHAVQDWLSGSARDHREAHRFLFEDESDFNEVCARAGMEPSHLRVKLLRLGRRPQARASLDHPAAA